MFERSFTAPDGRVWTFRPRSEVRREEATTHLTLEVETPGEARIVSCRREEWETRRPDLAGLLARSIPRGGSRGVPPS
jgi:hypothetical protein